MFSTISKEFVSEMIILQTCILMMIQSAVPEYAGSPCTDKNHETSGVCCHSRIQQALRSRRNADYTPLPPCCATCGDFTNSLAATKKRPTSGPRISERKCAQYGEILTLIRTKTNEYYDFTSKETQLDGGLLGYSDLSYPSSYLDILLPSEAVVLSPSKPTFPSSETAILWPSEPAYGFSESAILYPSEAGYSIEDLTLNTPAPEYAALGGKNAEIFEFPHMAALGWPRTYGGYSFSCGGTLISENYVMTAGHCLSNTFSEPTIVRLGDLNILENVTDGVKPIDVPIKRIIRHPDYKPPCRYFDIALLELQSSVPLSDHINPACLWSNATFGDDKMAIVTGWGAAVSGGKQNTAILQKVNLDILETSVCQPLLLNNWNRNWQGFGANQLCAGVLAGGKDACQGDSGGPLQIRIKGYFKKYHVIGVTSFGRECGRPNLPGVYTRVSTFLDWIESVVWPTGE